MKKSLFTMALVAAGAVIYLLSKNKEETSETPEIKLIDLKKDNHERESHNESTEDAQKEDPVAEQKDNLEAVQESEKEEPALTKGNDFSDLMSELEQEFDNEPNSENQVTEEPAEEGLELTEEVQESVIEEEVQDEPVLESAEEAVQKENDDRLPVEEKIVEVEESAEEVDKEEPEIKEQPEEEPVQTEELAVPDYLEEPKESEEKENEESELAVKDLQGKILNEVEQEIKDNNDFSDFVRGNQQKDEEPRYSGTVYEVSDLYPYLSYEMIDKILDANIGFNHVYHDNQPIKIVHRVGFDKIEDLIEFVILIKEHDYRVEENNGLDMISISKELIVEDTIIISDIFNVSNQVYRLHGHYQGYEIIEQ